MKSLTIPKSKHFITNQFSINLSWQAAPVPCKSYNLFAFSSWIKWVLWPLIMNCRGPWTLSGYHSVQQQQQHSLGIQLRTKFSTERRNQRMKKRVCLSHKIKDPLEKLTTPKRLRYNKYDRTAKDTFTFSNQNCWVILIRGNTLVIYRKWTTNRSSSVKIVSSSLL